jgi:hypothetical protein
MASTKLTRYSPKSDAMRFSVASVPSVLTVPAHGASLTVKHVGDVNNPAVSFTKDDFTFDNCWFISEFANIRDADFILPTPPVPEKLQSLSSGSTAQTPKKETNTLSPDDLRIKVAPLIKLSGHEGPVRRFKVLQQFEGKVTELYEVSGTFRADLIDLTDSAKERESAEFSLDEIHPADRSLVTPGSVFYWIMGFETTPSDYKRVSEIRLRRSPPWSEYEIEAITREGHELYSKFTSGERNASTSK